MNTRTARLTIAGGIPLSCVLGIVLGTGLFTAPSVARATVCGTDDCTGYTPWTFYCCQYSLFRCEIWKRRVCSVNPAGFEYEKILSTLGTCNTSDPMPELGQVTCTAPE